MNLLNKRDFQAVNKVSLITLQQANIKLFAYNSKEPMPVLGEFQAQVGFKLEIICFYVVDSYSSTSLTGVNTGLELGFLKIMTLLLMKLSNM